MNETLTIRLDAKLASALRAEAERTGLAEGEIVRQASQQRLERDGKPSVMSRHFGTICGPADLSTNKAYRREMWGEK